MKMKTTYTFVAPICCLLLCVVLQEAKGAITALGSLTTTIEGGIAGDQHSIKPYIAFKGDVPIFANHTITALDEGTTFTIASDQDDSNFSKFIKKLTNHSDDVLKVGHKIGVIKSDLGSLESVWFNNTTGFRGKKITHITLTYEAIDFSSSATLDNWTDFTYRITLTVFGKATNINYGRVDYRTLKDSSFEGIVTAKRGQPKNVEKTSIQTVTDDQHLIFLKKNATSPQNVVFPPQQFQLFLMGIAETWNLRF